jgi:hypothetical protein
VVAGWNWQVAEQQSVGVPFAAPSSHCSPSSTLPLPHLLLRPQTFGVPLPPQVCGAGQVPVPQVTVPPQPSGMVPQFFPWAVHVVGVQTHIFVAVADSTRPPTVVVAMMLSVPAPPVSL